MKENIIKIAIENKIDLIGFCSTNLDNDDLKKLYEYQELKKYKTSFQVGTIKDKLLLGDKYKKYKSVIAIGLSYNKQVRVLKSDEVILSSCAIGKDYHQVLKEKLNIIGKYISKNNGIFQIYVDNNSLDERYLAYKCGLGFYGKNHLLINDQYGTYFFIGIILTDLEFEYDTPVKKKCFECKRCVEKCPMNVLNDKVLKSNKCLSYLTQRKNITEEEMIKFNNCVYGCDICQEVCPHNVNLNNNNNFKSDGIELINCDKFLNMSKEMYEKLYSNNSSYWRGKEIIDRNIRIYKKNKIDYKKLI